MKKKVAACVAALALLSMAGCSCVNERRGSVLSGYSTVLVKPLFLNEAVLQKVSGNEQEEFEKAKPALTRVFNESFGRTLPKTSLPHRLVFEGSPDRNTIVLEPKVSLIDPGIKGVLRGRGVAVCRVTDGGDGKLLRTFAVSREVGRHEQDGTSAVIEELVREMGAGAAWEMAESK